MIGDMSMRGNLAAKKISAKRAPLSWRVHNTLRWSYIWGWIVNSLAVMFSRLTGIVTLTSELRVRARLAEQARVNISEFIFSKSEPIVDKKTGEIYYVETFGINWDAIKQRGHLVKSIAPTANGIKLELHDGQVALIQIGKGLGILKETTEHTGVVPVCIVEVVKDYGKE